VKNPAENAAQIIFFRLASQWVWSDNKLIYYDQVWLNLIKTK